MSPRASLIGMVLPRVAISILFLLIAVPSCPETARSQWVSQDILSDATELITVDFAGLKIGAAGGYNVRSNFNGRAVYTSDGGIHWIAAQVPDSARALVTLTLIGPDTGYVAGAYNLPIAGIPQGIGDN